MCDCLKTTQAEIKQNMLDSLKEKGQEIVGHVDECSEGFQCKGLSFSSGGWVFLLPLEFKYILRKKDGTPEKRTTTHKVNLLASFCPICGEKKE